MNLQPAGREHWIERCGGDEVGADLALAAAEATVEHKAMRDLVRAGARTTRALERTRAARQATREGLVRHFGGPRDSVWPSPELRWLAAVDGPGYGVLRVATGALIDQTSPRR